MHFKTPKSERGEGRSEEKPGKAGKTGKTRGVQKEKGSVPLDWPVSLSPSLSVFLGRPAWLCV